MKDIAKVDDRRGEGDGVNCKDSQDRELHREDLVSTDHFDGYSHGELLILILGRLLILLSQVLLAVSQDRSVWLELEPYVEGPQALDIPQCRVKLKVLLEALGEEKLDFHGLSATVVQDYLFTVELVIDEHVQVVLGFGHIDGHIDALTEDFDGDGVTIVLVIEEESKRLRDRAEFVGDKGEGDLC